MHNTHVRLNSTETASIAVFISASLWGVYWIPLRYLEEQGISGVMPIVLLSLPAAIVLMIRLALKGELYDALRSKSFVMGIFTGLGIAFYSIGVLYSSVARATLLFYLTPLWATLIELFIFKEKVNAWRFTALAIGLIGATLLLSGATKVPLNVFDFIALLSGIFWAVGASVLKAHSTANHATQNQNQSSSTLSRVTFCHFICAALGASLLGLLIPPSSALAPAHYTVQTLSVILLVSLCGLLPMMLTILWAQSKLSAGRVGLLMMSEIVVAVISANLLLPEEALGGKEWLGAALVISAAIIEVLKPKDTNHESERR